MDHADDITSRLKRLLPLGQWYKSEKSNTEDVLLRGGFNECELSLEQMIEQGFQEEEEDNEDSSLAWNAMPDEDLFDPFF